MRVQFADFVFDSRSGLFHHDQPVPLSGTAAEVLRILIEHRGEEVDKEVLLRRVWRTDVGESSLTTAISQVRRALGDARDNPHFIRTHHRTGYSFIAEFVELDSGIRPVPIVSVFSLDGPDGTFRLINGENVVGRDPRRCSICLSDPVVSRSHARIAVSGLEVRIEDLSSRHGTFVRNRRVTAPTPLADGDRIRFGGPELVLRRADADTVPIARTATEN